jgi:2-dehydropantoate 2-reductase
MRIAVMGVGGVGAPFGAALANDGHDVTFIARGDHLEAIRRNGLRITGTRDLHVDPARATDRPESVEPVDVILFTVKLWAVREAGEAIRPMLKPGTAVIALQNGVDAEAELADVIGFEFVMGGVAEISAVIDSPGQVRVFSEYTRLRFGELNGGESSRGEVFHKACTRAGIEAYLVDDIEKALWEKFAMLAPVSGLTSVTRGTFGDMQSDPDIRRMLLASIEEVIAVGKARGVRLDTDAGEKTLGLADSLPPAGRASMAIDLDQGNRLELPWLSGAVVRLGRELGIPVPTHEFMYAALKLHEGGKRQS